jgi:O-antigen ligase
MSDVSLPCDFPRHDGGRAVRLGRSLYAVAAGSLVAAMFLPLAALIRQPFRRILLAVVLVEMVFAIDVNFSLREEALVGALEGFNVSLTTLAIAGLYASWVIGFLAREPSSPRRVRMNWPLALYMGCVTVSMLSAYDIELSQFELFLLVQTFLVHMYVASSLPTRQDILFAVALLLIGVVLEGIMVIPSIAMGRDLAFAGITSYFYEGRAYGTFGSPNLTASYLALLLAPCAGLMLARVSGRLKALAMVAFVLGTITLIFTQSRGAWTSFALSMTLLGLTAWWRGYFSLRVPLLMATAVMVLVLPFASLIGNRITGDDHGSARSRLPLAILASKVIDDHPWLGIGPNNFAVVAQRYVTSEFAGEWFYVVHTKYLLVWAESGLWALLAFILFLVTTLRHGWRLWRLGDPILAPLALGFTAAILGHMEHMFFDVFNSRPQIQTLWVISALIVAMCNIRADGDATAADRGLGCPSR